MTSSLKFRNKMSLKLSATCLTSQIVNQGFLTNLQRLREKVHNGLSRCQTKRRMAAYGRAHRSFGMTPAF